MQIAVVSTVKAVRLVRLTVRHASKAAPTARLHVLDVDGTYVPVANEVVHSPQAIGLTLADLHRRAIRLEPIDLVRSLYPDLVRSVSGPTAPVTMALLPGVLLFHDPAELAEHAPWGPVLVARTAGPIPLDGRCPDLGHAVRDGAYSPALALFATPAGPLDLWEHAVRQPELLRERWLEGLAAAFPHTTLRDPAVLVSAWSLRPEHLVTGEGTPAAPLRLDGRRVTALDLSAWDPDVPWLLDATMPGVPRARLSDHPALAAIVVAAATSLQHEAEPAATGTARAKGSAPGTWDVATTSVGTPVDAVLRSIYRSLAPEALALAPDPFDPLDREELVAWLADPGPRGGPGRYLRALHSSRPDLQHAFPAVPGHDAADFLDWTRTYAAHEGYPATLIDEALSRMPHTDEAPVVPRRPGVNVVGYLTGELGIGESARLMVAALDATRVRHATVPVDRHLMSRQRYGPSAQVTVAEYFDTSLICVNADLTGSVAASIPEILTPSYRIGMWYWEVENFPTTQHDGFTHVDEVWVATEFVRRAIEPHSPVPVRTVTPPLPQRGPAPTLTRTDLGLPDRPVFLFSFDYLSTAERKNPLGLLDAFERAFPGGEGPVLVIKSINADRRPSEAERVRLRAAGSPAVLLIEEYLDAEARDALVALCDVYISLHRSEGLGLTMAEAMAWGKPVIATGYSGNLQFMTQDNSFLVPWTPVRIPPGAEPYPPGGVWAEPDLDAAADLMRLVIDQPGVAAARGAQAARDIARLHSPKVAGARIAAGLKEAAARRRAAQG